MLLVPFSCGHGLAFASDSPPIYYFALLKRMLVHVVTTIWHAFWKVWLAQENIFFVKSHAIWRNLTREPLYEKTMPCRLIGFISAFFSAVRKCFQLKEWNEIPDLYLLCWTHWTRKSLKKRKQVMQTRTAEEGITQAHPPKTTENWFSSAKCALISGSVVPKKT